MDEFVSFAFFISLLFTFFSFLMLFSTLFECSEVSKHDEDDFLKIGGCNMNKFEFHLMTAFKNYFNESWIKKCRNVSTLLGFKEWLEKMLFLVNKELDKIEWF